MARKRRLRIASYNINGINSRLNVLTRWLQEFEPDIVGLQELKCTDDAFPQSAIEALGYSAIWHGQPPRSWNGVALLSRVGEPVETRRSLPRDPNLEQSRYIEAAICGILVGNMYAPNGNPWLDFSRSSTSKVADPLFLTPGADFRIQTNSPAAGAGTIESVTAGWDLDFVGQSVPGGLGVARGSYQR